MRWLLHIEVWFSTLATLRCVVQGVVQRYQWGVQAALCLCVLLASFADKPFKVLEDPGIVRVRMIEESRLRMALSPNA